MGKEDILFEHIDATLASVPTTAENEDHIRAIEDDANAEVSKDVEAGWITVEEGELIIRGLHIRIHPESP